MNIYYDKDADLGKLKGKRVAIIGYGSQGHAHANNLKEGGIDIIVAEAEGSDNWKKAAAAGFEVIGTEREVGRKHRRWLDVVLMQRML